MLIWIHFFLIVQYLLKVLKISSANGNYAHKKFIETEFSYNKDAKSTWLACQGYSYEANPGGIAASEITRRKTLVRASAECTFYGKVAVDFFTCDRHLLSGVTLRISFRRSIDDFSLISDDAAKSYKIKITEANLYVRKMTLNDDVVSAIEKTLLSSPASYPYLETITKTFLASAGLQSWKQEDVFGREPIRRLAICLNTNEAFLGSKLLNPFHYRKFNLEQTCIYRNGLPVADSPISTDDSKRVYFNTMSDLAYIDNGHGISLEDYPNHFIMVFDLTSTQQASHDFIHPELTNCSVSIELKFSAALAHNVEIFIIGGESKYHLYWFVPESFKESYFNKLMDEDNLNSLIQRCSELKYKFRGVYAADNFPTNLTDNSFIIVNISTSASIGTHWILLCQKDQNFFLQIP